MEQSVIHDIFFYKGIEVNYRGGTEDENVLGHSFEKDIFFREIPSFKPSARPVIIDIGAHIGTFSLLSSMKFPEATIFAYEPSRDTFEILKKNKASNRLDRMKVFHEAVSTHQGTTRLFHSVKTGNWGHSITKELSDSFEVVNTTTLEAIVRDNKIDFIDLIKFNCEGAEFGILHNTPHEIIKKIGSGIILYHEDLDAQGGNAGRLAALFKTLNFRVINVRKGNGRGWLIVWNRRKYSRAYFIIQALIRKMKV